MASPPGIKVPYGGSCCANCKFVSPIHPFNTCVSHEYINISYLGKKSGDNRFVDGYTGKVIDDPMQFCCNVYEPKRGLT